MKKIVTSMIVALLVLVLTQVNVKAVYINFLDENGGTKIGYMEHVNGTVSISVDDPIRDGYDFLGWSSDDDNITIDGNELTSAYPQGYGTPATVYATWALTEYDITYYLDGGVAEGNPDRYTMEDEFTLNNPTRDGYEFAGWTDIEGQELGMTIMVSAGAMGNMEFCALWTPIEYNIEYDLDGGSVESENPTTYTAEDEFTLNNPTKDGYEFKGWVNGEEEELGTDVTVEKGTYGDLKFIATWEKVEEEEEENTNNPKTSDNTALYVVALIVSACGIGIFGKKLLSK